MYSTSHIFFFQAEDGIRDGHVTGVQTCALPIYAGRLGIDPFAPELIQPSSVDVRIDKYFRVFNNSKYTHIDPKQDMPDLTTERSEERRVGKECKCRW